MKIEDYEFEYYRAKNFQGKIAVHITCSNKQNTQSLTKGFKHNSVKDMLNSGKLDQYKEEVFNQFKETFEQLR